MVPLVSAHMAFARAAEERGCHIVAEHADEDERGARQQARERQRQVDPQEGADRRCACI